MTFVYPKAKRVDQVDDYHGIPVADPYRWLEDPGNDATKAFIAAENELTFGYLHNLAERKRLRDRIAQLWDVPRTEAPQRRAATTVWAHNDGLANQPTFYVQDGGGTRELLDPNALSDDGTVAVVVTSLSDDGRHFAYTTAEAGSDWQTLHIRDTATGGDLPEVLGFVKHTAIAWHQDGFFYSRFPEQDPASTEPSRNQSVWFHRLGTESDDRVVPMHAMKFAAGLQHAAGGTSERPLLLRVDTRSGHGLGKPTDTLIEEMADIYGFLLHHLSA